MKIRKKWICILLSAICLFQINILSVEAEEYWPVGPEIPGESAIVMEASTGTVLYEKNAHEQLYPASITKIMTSLLAIEKCSLDEQVTFSYDAVHKIEGTHIFRDVDEVMTMEQCLYGVLLNSANDCAYAVAEHAGGTYDNFIKMMNDKAAALGCLNTNFTNPHGLPDENHYTSSYDMALITREALKNETFRLISSEKKYTIPFTNKHPDEETPMVNHHKMLAAYKGDRQYLYEGCIGGKTGYTVAAGNTLVTYAEKNGMTLICVVMKEQTPNHYLDTKSLLDYCFENFQLLNVVQNETTYNQELSGDRKFDNKDSFVGLNKEGMIVLPKSAAFTDAVSQVVENNSSKDVVGTLQYTYAGRVIGGTNIEVTGAKVQPFPFEEKSVKKEKEKVLKISTKTILLGILIVILLIGAGFGIYHLLDNFYLIRYKWESRRNFSFKEKGTRKRKKKRGDF